MELAVDEELLDKYIKLVSSNGEMPHKGIKSILENIRMLGYIFRDYHNIVLHRSGIDAEMDEEYGHYLDKRAAGLKIDFEA